MLLECVFFLFFASVPLLAIYVSVIKVCDFGKQKVLPAF